MPSTSTLSEFVAAKAEELGVPGAAVGVIHDGTEEYAFHGVTSVENPQPVDAATLFQSGSTTKTFTATAIVRLVDQGLVDLDAPVRTYVPELTLQDESVAATVTVLHLLNHTAGWSGDLMDNTGDGDDALERYVARMATLPQESPLGAAVSYNNAAFSLAGRLIEKVTGQTYERAIRELLLDPLGMTSSWFFPAEVMTRRFAVGHNQKPDGSVEVSRNWALPRSAHPAGGITATAADQLAWARFHVGDGVASDGKRLLSAELLARMQQPTVDVPGGTGGVGISWFLGDVAGTRTVSHGGTTNGQHSSFTLVPEHQFGITSMTNCGPNGPQLNSAVLAWALDHYLGLTLPTAPDVTPLSLTEEELLPFTGNYETVAVVCAVTVENGGLVLTATVKPEALAQLASSGQAEAGNEAPPFPLALVAGEGDPFVVIDGPAKGMGGTFARDDTGAVVGLHFGGRMATRAT